MILRALVQVALFPFPWAARRRALSWLFRYELAPDAHIGLSIIVPRRSLVMAAGAAVGNFTLIKGMDDVELGARSVIGNFNWFYAVPHSAPQMSGLARETSLTLEREANITSRHLVDCSCPVRVCEFATLGGSATQVITRQVDITQGRMVAAPVTVGAAALIGSRCILLPGSVLAPRCALAAGSVLRTKETDEYQILSGVPAKKVADLSPEAKYFTRDHGRVY